LHASRTALITVVKEAELHAECKIKRIRSDEGTELVYTGDLDDSKSITGNTFVLNGGQKSRKQQNLAMSTVEAEYMALSTALREATHVRQKLTELQGNLLSQANGTGSAELQADETLSGYL
jgi:hypothetical protein